MGKRFDTKYHYKGSQTEHLKHINCLFDNDHSKKSHIDQIVAKKNVTAFF